MNRSNDLARTVFQLLLIGALIAGGFWILSPFLAASVWAATMVVATWPLLLRAQSLFGGRRAPAVAVMTIALSLILILPAYAGVSTIVGRLDEITAAAKSVIALASSPPPDWLDSVPILGEKIAAYWRELAEVGPDALYDRVAPYLQTVTSWLLRKVGGLGAILIEFLLAIGIASVLYANGETAAAGLRRFARRVGGEQTENALELAGQAVRAVALGVGLTALIQASLAGIGLAVAGIPFSGALTAVILVLCVAQLGPGIVVIPAIAWLYWEGRTGAMIGLIVWAIPVIMLDSFLRPALIKRGADLPLLLILPGVIGGLIAFGVIGLFIGPVLLAVGYTLLSAWVGDGESPA